MVRIGGLHAFRYGVPMAHEKARDPGHDDLRILVHQIVHESLAD